MRLNLLSDLPQLAMLPVTESVLIVKAFRKELYFCCLFFLFCFVVVAVIHSENSTDRFENVSKQVLIR